MNKGSFRGLHARLIPNRLRCPFFQAFKFHAKKLVRIR
jgi:hypothetical protein